MKSEIITLGDLKLNLEELAEFIVWAKKTRICWGREI